VNIAEVEALLVGVYGQVERPVIIPASDARISERLVLSLWSQQWPALRGAFRFCTGSLSARTFAGRSFDLQVIPHRLLRELQRDPNAFVCVSISEHEGSLSETPDWARVGAADLIARKSLFRRFLWEYSENEAENRSFYSKAGNLFTFLEHFETTPDNCAVTEITRRVAETFPEPTNGVALKYGIYGAATAPQIQLPFIGEEARLVELAKTPFWRSFDATQLRLRERAGKLWKDTPSRGKSILLDLLDASSNPLADEIVAGLAESISAVDACEIAQERPGILMALVARNPFLVASEQFWDCKLPLHIYYWIFDFLKTDGAASIPATTWIPFLLDSRVNDLASAVVERFATETVSVFLERALNRGKQGNWIPDPPWRTALSGCQVELVAAMLREDFAASDCAMALLAGLLDAHRQELATHGLRPWLGLVRSGLDLVFEFPNAEAAGFLLSLGFQHSERDALQMIGPCFEHVHAAARDDSPSALSYRAWKSLERELPSLSWRRNWDKCERLRQGLVERFIHNLWPKEEFLRCVSRPATLLSALYSCRDVRGGEEFICLVAEEVFSGVLSATQPQADVLRGAFRRNWRGELKLDL
jgi:hypothetical protein